MTHSIELQDKFSPFSNGTQYMDWESSNCNGCLKNLPESSGCEIVDALGYALIDDGKIDEDIAKRMGYLSEDSTTNGNYVWFCTERDTGLGTPEAEATLWEGVRTRQLAAQNEWYRQQEEDNKTRAEMYELIYQLVTPGRLSTWQPQDKDDAWERYGVFCNAIGSWVGSHDGYPFDDHAEENLANAQVYALLYGIADRAAKEERKRVFSKLRAARGKTSAR